MLQADDARKAMLKLPARPSRRLRAHMMLTAFADKGRAKDTTVWLHEVNGDVATGKEKAQARKELGYGGDPGDPEGSDPTDPSDPGAQAARFIGREHLRVDIDFEGIQHRGMPLTYLDGLSDIEFTATSQTSKSRVVTTRWEVNGKHTGPLLGVPATGKHVTITGMTMVKFDEEPHPEGAGRVSHALEEWTYWDLPALAEQIGAAP